MTFLATEMCSALKETMKSLSIMAFATSKHLFVTNTENTVKGSQNAPVEDRGLWPHDRIRNGFNT